MSSLTVARQRGTCTRFPFASGRSTGTNLREPNLERAVERDGQIYSRGMLKVKRKQPHSPPRRRERKKLWRPASGKPEATMRGRNVCPQFNFYDKS